MPRKSRSNPRVQVFKTAKGWVVQKVGGQRASFIFDYKQDAVSKAREYRHDGYDIFIYKVNGRVQTILDALS